MKQSAEDDHPFEYYETQVEDRSTDPAALALAEPLSPPRDAGGGWVLQERRRFGPLLVFRWRRRKHATRKA